MRYNIGVKIIAPIEIVWFSWITPESIQKWNYAIDSWHCPKATISFNVGGKFSYRMEAKDGSFGFDFTGEFTSIKKNESIEYKLDDDRKVQISFIQTESGVELTETFEAEDENSGEQQRQGWQAILNNFKKFVENKVN